MLIGSESFGRSNNSNGVRKKGENILFISNNQFSLKHTIVLWIHHYLTIGLKQISTVAQTGIQLTLQIPKLFFSRIPRGLIMTFCRYFEVPWNISFEIFVSFLEGSPYLIKHTLRKFEGLSRTWRACRNSYDCSKFHKYESFQISCEFLGYSKQLELAVWKLRNIYTWYRLA